MKIKTIFIGSSGSSNAGCKPAASKRDITSKARPCSNVFNILLIIGIAALFIPLNAVASIDHLIILVAVTLVMFPILYTGHSISRKEGVLMLVFFGVFIWYAFFGYSYFI